VIANEIERYCIPVVQVTSIPQISQGLKVNRIFEGNGITHPFGVPKEKPENERQIRIKMLSEALEMFCQ